MRKKEEQRARRGEEERAMRRNERRGGTNDEESEKMKKFKRKMKKKVARGRIVDPRGLVIQCCISLRFGCSVVLLVFLVLVCCILYKLICILFFGPILETWICDCLALIISLRLFQVHPGDINMIAYGLATPQNSSLRDELSLALLQLQENGFLQSLYRSDYRSL